MTSTEYKILQEIRDNTKELKRIADKLDVIAKLLQDANLERETHRPDSRTA